MAFTSIAEDQPEKPKTVTKPIGANSGCILARTRTRLRSAPDILVHQRRVPLDYRALLPERFEVDLKKRYVLDKLVLGEGGYGQVFVARDSKFENRLVAVKKVTKTGDKETTEAYQEEIRTMRELDHPAICKLFETFEKGRHLFFVLEYCEGGELFGKITQLGCMSEAVAAEVTSQVVSALRYAHDRCIAHRDIKPENVVFCTKEPDDLRVKVIDWGVACSFAGQEMRSAVGSFTYAAPEVMMVSKVGAYTCKCDMWSLGVMTYVMLCGKPPFWGSPQNHLKKACAEKYPMEASPWDVVSETAKDFVKRSLRADPDVRLGSEDAAAHPWFASIAHQAGASADHSFKQVMGNLVQYRDKGIFMQLCITAVARQLDHKDLRDIHQVFRDMDTNGDGTLSMDEVLCSLCRMFGEGSQEAQLVEETFRSLDLDGSGSIDYTEFCAGGLGHHAATKADVVWAAFKLFDLDDNGRVSKSEIQSVLQNTDVQHFWSKEVCACAAQDILNRYDADGDGQIEFEDWMRAMHESWDKRFEAGGSSPSTSQASPARCPQGHAMEVFTSPKPTYICDLCQRKCHQGTEIRSCGQCNFNMCDVCSERRCPDGKATPLGMALHRAYDRLSEATGLGTPAESSACSSPP